MLAGLSVGDVVLIDRLGLRLRAGLNVLTGETGAGKSILLDALGLALGSRADAGLVRPGAAQASVAAEFDLPAAHPARALLDEHGLPAEDALVLRRVLGADGRSRAYVNDQPVGVALLRELGDLLVEVHGQHDERGLLNPAGHRALLDEYGALAKQKDACRAAHAAWREAEEAALRAEEELAKARADEEWLRYAAAELQALDPKEGEEAELAEQRALLQQGEKLAEALAEAQAALSAGGGLDARLRTAERALARVAARAGGRLDAALTALDRAAGEVTEAIAAVEQAGEALDLDPRRLEALEERLFALRDLARKHRAAVDALPALRRDLELRLAAVEDGGAQLSALRKRAGEARARFVEAAQALSKGRAAAARRLDKSVNAELAPLKLDRAKFQTAVEALPEADWTGEGADRVAFRIATNPGSPAGPLSRIASGGELSRFMLALKVALAQTRSATTLIFDEVDRGVGGAVADKVGERLARLAREAQILVVTHSPQVAARGEHHFRVAKQENGKLMRTEVAPLDETQRREEIARMLSGAEVTSEARAAAESLLQAGRA
jgi:DNA repair protein RecN (Recombination protein N)